MSKWDRRFLDLAALVATWSKDPSTQVGAVITDANNRIVSTGYNGFARGVDDAPEVYANRDEKYRRVIHGETNAILWARRDLTGTTLYLTAPPCARCAALIVQSGIARVVCRRAPPDFATRWGEDIASSLQMFAEAGVRYDELA